MLATEFNESGAMFSPDGKWIAYESDESGRAEVYVRAFPGPGDRRQVSREGASAPKWAPGGNEIYYRHGEVTLAVKIQTRPELKMGAPAVLFEHEDAIATGLHISSYDVAPDGRRFLAVVDTDDELRPTEIDVVLE